MKNIKKLFFCSLFFSLSASAQTQILRPENLETLSKKLGFISKEEGVAAYLLFSQRLESGFMTDDWLADCKKNQKASLCEVLEDYFHYVKNPKPKSNIRSPARNLGKLRRKSIPQYQKESFQSLLESLPSKNLRFLVDYAHEALKSTGCPQNLSLALAYELEHTMNKKENVKLVEDLFEKGLPCSSPSESWYELAHMRYALLSVALDKPDRAIKHFTQSLAATNAREDYRSLYYLAKLLEKKNPDEAEKYFNALVDKYPRSWYSIQLLSKKGLDPLKMNLRTAIAPDVYSLPNARMDQRFTWLKMGLLLEKDTYKLKTYAEYIADLVSKDMEFGYIQHIVRLLHSADIYKAQINILNRYLTMTNPPVTKEILEYLYPNPFLELFNLHGVELDTAVLLGLARQESSFDVRAKSGANAWGLLQLLPSTAKHLGSQHSNGLWSASESIRFASKYLIRLAKRFNNSIERSLAAYNAGPSRVEEWEKDYSWIKDPELFVDLIPYRETRDYVPTILRNAYWYHRLYPGTLNITKKEYVTSGLLKPLIMNFK